MIMVESDLAHVLISSFHLNGGSITAISVRISGVLFKACTNLQKLTHNPKPRWSLDDNNLSCSSPLRVYRLVPFTWNLTCYIHDHDHGGAWILDSIIDTSYMNIAVIALTLFVRCLTKEDDAVINCRNIVYIHGGQAHPLSQLLLNNHSWWC